MKRHAPTKEEALRLSRELKECLIAQGIPVRALYLFGSIAKGKTHSWSDIDIAVVHDAFADTRFDERTAICRAEGDLDVRVEMVCLHPEDMQNKYSTIVQEIRKHGIAV